MIDRKTVELFLATNSVPFEEAAFLSDKTETNENELIFNIKEISTDFLRYILFNDSFITPRTKTELTLLLLQNKQHIVVNEEACIWDSKIKTLSDVCRVCEKLLTLKYNCDYQFKDRYYPCYVLMAFMTATKSKQKHIKLSWGFEICSIQEGVVIEIGNDLIINLKKQIEGLTFAKLMAIFKVHKQKVSVNEYLKSLEKAKEKQSENG